jgi:hypothetical protein
MAKLTVRTIPAMTRPKLKLCCVARAAFSPADSSAHGTNPSSLKAVTFRRRVLGLGLVPSPVCVAYVRDRMKAPELTEGDAVCNSCSCCCRL